MASFRLTKALRALREARSISESDYVEALNREVLPFLSGLRSFIAQLVEGTSDLDMLLTHTTDGEVDGVEWGLPKSKEQALVASEISSAIDFGDGLRVDLTLDATIASLALTPPTLADGQVVHVTIAIHHNGSGSGITAYSSNVYFPDGTLPNFTARTNGQWDIMAAYCSGKRSTMSFVHSGPFG